MKKRGIALILICFLVLLTLTGCGSRKAITTDTFKSETGSLGYEVVDVLEQFTDYTHVKEATLAYNADGEYQVEFYVLESAEEAKGMFENNKNIFEESKGSSSVETYKTIGNYSIYSLNTDGYYMHVCRIDNTLVYVNEKAEHKDSIIKLLKKIGYN